jgi:hypothetical protein
VVHKGSIVCLGVRSHARARMLATCRMPSSSRRLPPMSTPATGSPSPPRSPARDHDIVLFGATGFTGRLVAGVDIGGSLREDEGMRQGFVVAAPT